MPGSTYLNTAAFGLIDSDVKRTADAFYTDLAARGSGVSEQWRAESEPRIRAAIAGFIGAAAANVAMIPNFSWGINAVVQSLRGDEKVLLYRGDYPSLLEPFRLNGFDIRWVDAPDGFAFSLDIIADCIRRREVDMVALSHVQYRSGFQLPVAEIGGLCKEHGVRFIVDATQSLGATPIDVVAMNIDALIASNYKWMNAGFGTGILYLSDDFLRQYPPVVGGNNSSGLLLRPWQKEDRMRGYEPGHPNMYGLMLLESAILHKQSLGVAAIEAHNTRLTARLLEGLRELNVPVVGSYDMAYRAPFVSLQPQDRLAQHIAACNIIITSPSLRISIHYYNQPEEVARILDCLKTFRSQ